MFALKRTSQPHLHQIEPTNACPYSCVMCPRASKMTRPVGYMSMNLFCKVIDEVKTYAKKILAKEVELFHFGESLLHPEIVEMTTYAANAGLNTVLSVNAPEFTIDKAAALFKAGADKIIISLDGYDHDSYKRFRGSHADYEKAVKNISEVALMHVRDKHATKLVVRMIVINENIDRAVEFKKKWQGHGLEVDLREFFPWGEKEMVDLGNFEKYPAFMPCPFPWQYLVVQWNGDVVACCRDYNGKNVMGNVADSSLQDIWNGPAYDHFRKCMADASYADSICQHCMEIYYTEGK
ncbi:MAG: SPASM domain-containing protein [Candidatus Riflebacteria bacterium]|nr:SPASM domain-containing protein [Candidatus Riflebacteria bacterium]